MFYQLSYINDLSVNTKKIVRTFQKEDCGLLRTRLLAPNIEMNLYIAANSLIKNILSLYERLNEVENDYDGISVIELEEGIAIHLGKKIETVTGKDMSNRDVVEQLIGKVNTLIRSTQKSFSPITNRESVFDILLEDIRYKENTKKQKPAAPSHSTINTQKTTPPHKATESVHDQRFQAPLVSIAGINDASIRLSRDNYIRVISSSGCEYEMQGNTFSVKAERVPAKISSSQSYNLNIFNSSVQGVAIGNNIQINNCNMSMSSGGMNISVGNATQHSSKIALEIPKGTTIKLKTNGNDKADIGDIEGDVDIVTNGFSEVNIGKTAKFNANLTGQSAVKVDTVVGNVELELSGQSHISIKGGAVPFLEMEVSGQSTVNIDAHVNDAQIETSGVSNVTLGRVAKKPSVEKNGMSRVNYTIK
ncbi:MAG: hypothetical protein AAB870_03230 [Patescibacteria group bacterium]